MEVEPVIEYSILSQCVIHDVNLISDTNDFSLRRKICFMSTCVSNLNTYKGFVHICLGIRSHPAWRCRIQKAVSIAPGVPSTTP